MVRHLVLGASGQLGEQIVSVISLNKEEPVGTFFSTPLYGFNNDNKFLNKYPKNQTHKLDIKSFSSIKNLIYDINPDIVYLPAAITNVDFCEQKPEKTKEDNVFGVINVVNAINEVMPFTKHRQLPKLVFLSSDYVFDGTRGPYSETDIENPICEYGKQKLQAEQYIKEHYKSFFIIRTTGVFGPETQGKNFVMRLLKSLNQKTEIKIPNDEFSTPTYSLDLAKTIFKLCNTEKFGIYNIAGKTLLSRFDFSKLIADTFNIKQNNIIPISSSSLNRTAKRPLLSGLKTDKINSTVEFKPKTLVDALLDMKKRLKNIL